MQTESFDSFWDTQANMIGRRTIFPLILLCFLPNIYLYLIYGFVPPIDAMIKTWGMVAVVFGAFYVVEPMSYYPILGLAGTYISFTTGNIGNMRVPCSAIAQEVVGVTPETPEAEIISTLGITGSVVTNLIAVSIAAVAGAQLLAMFPESIADAFKNYSAPAIFGAILGQFAIQNIKLGVIAVLIAFGMFFSSYLTGIAILGAAWFVIIVTIAGTVGCARLFYVNSKKA